MSTDFYPTNAAQTLYPGRYAVIGPSAVTTIGRLTNMAGAGQPDTTQDGVTTGRQITLSPSAMTGQVQVVNNDSTGSNTPTDIQQPVAVIIDQPTHLNVSEPLGGYGAPFTGTSGGEQVYSPTNSAQDSPLAPPTIPSGVTSTTLPIPNYCQIYLQRLANPLLAYNATTNPY